MAVNYTRSYGHAPASAVNRKPPAKSFDQQLAEVREQVVKATASIHANRAELVEQLSKAGKLDEARALLADPRTAEAYQARMRGEDYAPTIAKGAAPVSRAEQLARDPGLAKREWDAAVAKRGR